MLFTLFASADDVSNFYSVSVFAASVLDAELAVQPVSELVHMAGIDFVGPIPSEVQYISVFSAAVVTESKEVEASKRLISFLASEKASVAIRQAGMEPAKNH